MAHYNVRDMLGHWVKPRSQQGKMCRHACCRNKRPHPANYPVILPSSLLRQAPDDYLAQHYDELNKREDDKAERGRAQILWEMDRRDQAEVRRRAARDRRQARMFSRKMEREELIEWQFVRAEEQTRGNLLNRAGLAAGVSDRSLFSGPESRARRYASEELLNYWLDNPRPTTAMLRGEDTRLTGGYTTRPRTRRR